MDLGLVGKTQRPVTNAHVNQPFIRFCHVNPFIRRYETSFFPIFSSIEYVYCTASRFSDIFFLLYGRGSNLSELILFSEAEKITIFTSDLCTRNTLSSCRFMRLSRRRYYYFELSKSNDLLKSAK